MNLIKNFSVFNGAYYLARFADQGLSNALGLATLRHGTNPYSWLSIHLMGADPAYGNHAIGGAAGGLPENQNRFFVAYGYKARLISKSYAITGSSTLVSKIIPCIIGLALGILIGEFLPNIKFRFSDNEIERWFQEAPLMPGEAKFTRHPIYPWRMGLIGTVWAGLTPYTIVNMCKSPLRVITGVAQLALVGYVAFYVCPYMKSFRVAAIAGAVLAII